MERYPPISIKESIIAPEQPKWIARLRMKYCIDVTVVPALIHADGVITMMDLLLGNSSLSTYDALRRRPTYEIKDPLYKLN